MIEFGRILDTRNIARIHGVSHQPAKSYNGTDYPETEVLFVSQKHLVHPDADPKNNDSWIGIQCEVIVPQSQWGQFRKGEQINLYPTSNMNICLKSVKSNGDWEGRWKVVFSGFDIRHPEIH